LKKVFAVLVMVSMLLNGCARQGENSGSQPKLVTRITAVFDSGTIRLERSYTDSDKMRSVLTYLRCLKTYGTAQPQPGTAGDEHATITLHYSDGTTKIYDQQGSQYLRVSGGDWKAIKPEQAQELPLLLGLMESD